MLLHQGQQLVTRHSALRFIEKALGHPGLRACVQQPGIQRRAAHHVQVRARSVRTRSKGTAVLAVLHVGAHQGHFSVCRMQDAGSALKRQQCGLQLKCRQRSLTL